MTDRGLPDDLAAALRARYREPHRHYHDERHLDAVLAHVAELADEAADPQAVRLAAWFHDAVYDPHRTDSEQASARLARELLTARDARPEVVAEVTRLVLLTAHHRPQPGDSNGQVLCDADLAILGSDDDGYDRYARAVRREYADVDDTTFRAGRAAVLRALLDAEPLFRTAAGAARWERAARANLRRELAALESGVSGAGGADPRT